MADQSLLTLVDQDLALIYDVVAKLTKLDPNSKDTQDLITRLHDEQTRLLAVRQQLAGG